MEYKFRGFTKENIQIENTIHSIIGCIPESVKQYTGIKDKNGVEIYADNVMEDHIGNRFRIYHIRGGFVFKAGNWKEDLSDFNESDYLIAESMSDLQNAGYISSKCKVIGNIYQNKDLSWKRTNKIESIRLKLNKLWKKKSTSMYHNLNFRLLNILGGV
jgi:uncharacterized phage protein (TIGR01671 family)